MDYQTSVAAAAAAHGTSEPFREACVSPFDCSLFDGFYVCGRSRKVARVPPTPCVPQHPLDLQQQQLLYTLEQQQLQRASELYGSHAGLRLKTEREFCAMAQRLPGIGSSMLGLETVMGLDGHISVCDYLGRERPSVEGGPMLSVHDLIEKTMGI